MPNTSLRTYRDAPRIRRVIELEGLPSPSTLCKASNWLDIAVWHVLLNLSVTLLPTNGVVRIDASGFDRSHGLKHYTKRAKLTIQQLKLTLLLDTRASAIIDLHVTTTRKHDPKITSSLIKRNTGEVAVLLDDKGYDDQEIRALAGETGVRPFIKHRKFSFLHNARNARLDVDTYGQRNQNEVVNSRFKRRYSAFVRSRHWWKQFRELVVCCLTHTSASHSERSTEVTQLSIRLSISVDAARNGLLSAAHKFIPDESPAAATVGTPAASSRVGGVTGTGSMSRTRTRTPARSNTDRAGSYFPLLADR